MAYEDVLRILRSGKPIDVAIDDIEILVASSIKHRDAAERMDFAKQSSAKLAKPAGKT
jgi:hypothetical protein